MKMVVTVSKILVTLIVASVVSSEGWDIGTGHTYDMITTILLGDKPHSELRNKNDGDVGFQLTAKLKVLPLWRHPTDSETILISIKTESLQLWIKSRKAPEPEGFVEHSSRLSDIPKDPILLLWKNGQIKSIFAVTDESLSSLNFKRGIASIFQYKTSDAIVQENDATGMCTVSYNSLEPGSFEKIKSSCKRNKLQNSNSLLGVKVADYTVTKYNLTESLLLKEITENEKHEMSLSAKPDARTLVTSHRTVKLLPEIFKEEQIDASTYTEIINKFYSRYAEVPIEAQHEHASCPETGCLTLEAVLENSRSALEASASGTIKAANAFLKLIPLIRDASAESLGKFLKSPRYRDILPQLYDLYGSASTPAAHKAAMKFLRQDEIGDNTERYLWALSTSSYPDPDVIKDILKRSEGTMQNDKVSETLALTAASMAKRYGNSRITEKVKNSLEVGLNSCTGEQCQMKFLRALGNLGTKTVIPVLLKFTDNSRAISIIAWKGIASFTNGSITNEIKTLAMKTFLQLNGKKVDSTIRTLALNVILENEPTVEEVQELLLYLTSKDSAYEIKKYLLQRLEQLSDNNVHFRETFAEALSKEHKNIVNYNILAQRGLSTAFTRSFLRSSGTNGSLVTIQEISSGILKQGVVDIVLENESQKYKFFSLGLFAGGLNSFVSSDDQDDQNEIPVENEVANAGMEISFFDVIIRPFVFFSGQGELMGHVWSGTASERTPAFQTTVNLHRHREIVALGSGFIIEFNVEGAISVDLSGQVQLSLWMRNAQSLVEMGAGIAIHGSCKILTDFVQSRAEFTLTLEPKLELASDLDFSGPISLCMKSVQPETVMKHNIYKVERIPGSRHKLRKTRKISQFTPGRSYLLNRKNNEMCSKIINE